MYAQRQITWTLRHLFHVLLFQLANLTTQWHSIWCQETHFFIAFFHFSFRVHLTIAGWRDNWNHRFGDWYRLIVVVLLWFYDFRHFFFFDVYAVQTRQISKGKRNWFCFIRNRKKKNTEKSTENHCSVKFRNQKIINW